MFIIWRSTNSLADLINRFHRILQNYEYAEDGLVFVSDILQHSNEKKQNFSKDLTRYTLGCLMKELFPEQVRLVQRGSRGNKQRVYLNLQRI